MQSCIRLFLSFLILCLISSGVGIPDTVKAHVPETSPQQEINRQNTARIPALRGNILVIPIFPDSDGSQDPSLSDWTPEEVRDVAKKVQQSLDKTWTKYAHLYGSYVKFTVAEPEIISDPLEIALHPLEKTQEMVMRIMARKGFTEGNAFERVIAFKKSIIAHSFYDEVSLVFYARDSLQTMTTGPGNASYLGHYSVVSYSFNNPDFHVNAHEIGHEIAFASDEVSGNSCGGTDLRPQALNGNGTDCTATPEPCIMKEGGGTVCHFTAAQVGWGDPMILPQITKVKLNQKGRLIVSGKKIYQDSYILIDGQPVVSVFTDTGKLKSKRSVSLTPGGHYIQVWNRGYGASSEFFFSP